MLLAERKVSGVRNHMNPRGKKIGAYGALLRFFKTLLEPVMPIKGTNSTLRSQIKPIKPNKN
jgi:hypothetical protein